MKPILATAVTLHNSRSGARSSRTNAPGSIWARSPALVKMCPALQSQQTEPSAEHQGSRNGRHPTLHCVPHLQHPHFSLNNSSHHHWHLHQQLELPPPSSERHVVQDMSVNKLTSGNGLCILVWQSDTCDSSTQALHEETGSESNKDWALTS